MPTMTEDFRTLTNCRRTVIARHPDGTTCVKYFLGLPCRRVHNVEEQSRPVTLYHWSGGEMSPGDVYYYPNWNGTGQPVLAGRFGQYNDLARYYMHDFEVRQTAERCPGCNRTIDRGRTFEIDGELYCSSCVTHCACHHEPHVYRGSRSTLHASGGSWYCEGEGPSCSRCDSRELGDYYVTDYDGHYVCTDCRPRCEDCGSYLSLEEGEDEYCETCESGGIRGYGHTHPTMWLGGPAQKSPDGKQEGYYLGIELEITADRYNPRTRPIRKWAKEHLGAPAALDLKHDSSVDGFEIVTQPMTPEFFEGVDWKSFMDMLNESNPAYNDREPEAHGMHVHIGRVAFGHNDVAIAAFCYLLGRDDKHMVRIARRQPTGYCSKIHKPVSEAIVSSDGYSAQKRKIRDLGTYAQRGAINLQNEHTIEIRAAKSTRDPQEFINSVRMVYVAAEYIRSLMRDGGFISPKALHWNEFARWTATAYPNAFASIAGLV